MQTSRPRPLGPDYASAELSRDGDAWAPRRWGDCRIEVSAPGWASAAFVLDPAVRPDPAHASISVLAWVKASASGRTAEPSQVRPVVLSADETSVSFVVPVKPATDWETCPSNPSFPVEIELGSPLGDRVVFGASFQPAHERPWPPTRSSLESTGDTDPAGIGL